MKFNIGDKIEFGDGEVVEILDNNIKPLVKNNYGEMFRLEISQLLEGCKMKYDKIRKKFIEEFDVYKDEIKRSNNFPVFKTSTIRIGTIKNKYYYDFYIEVIRRELK